MTYQIEILDDAIQFLSLSEEEPHAATRIHLLHVHFGQRLAVKQTQLLSEFVLLVVEI